ncbi:MAG: hypothetical protein HY286_08535 [Planctomycetes bacterium]|nr:hypothetical protein [Planctomycetota bacterium]
MAEIRVYNPLRDTIRPENYIHIWRAWSERHTLWADLMRLPQFPAMAASLSGRIMVANAVKPFLPLLASIARVRDTTIPPLDHPNPTGLPQAQFQRWIEDVAAASLAVRAHRPFFNELRSRTGWKGPAPDPGLFKNMLELLVETTPSFEPRGMIGVVDAELFGNEVRMASEGRVFHGANIVKFFAAAAKANPDDEYDVDVAVASAYQMQIAVYVVTMGAHVEELAREAGERKEGYRALLLDAIGSCVADTVALDLTIMVERDGILRSNGACVARKLSVGYGDWPLEEQRDIFAILNPEKNIGVSLNEACLMMPEKSVSGLIGMKRKG